MANNYVYKTFDKSITNDNMNKDSLGERFTTVMTNVANMLKTEGPIYHTWIAFQVGTNDQDDMLTYYTDTNDPNRNGIVSLDITKTCAGSCNNFTLKIMVDPFNYGQESQSQIEILDEMLAQAMSHEITDDTSTDNAEETLKGYLQYGYSSTQTDSLLTSPYYEFYLTDVSLDVNTSSGLSTYTFEGVTTIATSCDNEETFPSIAKDDKILEKAILAVYKYYGNKDYPPSKTCNIDINDNDVEVVENEYNYRIDIDADLYNDSPTAETATRWRTGEASQIETVSGVNAISYMEDLLNDYPLTQTEIDSGNYEYKDYWKLDYSDQPRYIWWITDEVNQTGGVNHTIHISHYATQESIDSTANSDLVKLDYNNGIGLTWGLQENNIVVNWSPSIDTYTYLIRRARYLSVSRKYENSEEINEEELTEAEDNLAEYYNASLTTVGIPADPPICGALRILPRIEETVSRTAGWYIIKKCSDSISTRGVYTSTFELMRIANVDDDLTTEKVQSVVSSVKVET